MKVHPDATGAQKKRTSSHRRVPRRLDHQDSCGCRGCSNGSDVLAVARLDPWEYDREMYKRRNEVERLFRRLKGFRRVFAHFDRLDVMFLGFISFALIADGIVC